MAMTMTEKILARAAGKESVAPGDLIMAKLDLALGNDVTAGVAIGLACPRSWCGVFREAGRLNSRISATVATARVEISDSDQASRSSVPAKIPWRIASGQTAYATT